MTETTGCEQVREASKLSLLAHCFALPDTAFVELLCSGQLQDAMKEAFGDEAHTCVESLNQAYITCDKLTVLHRIRTEYTRLFVGAPIPVVSPYESVHRAVREDREVVLMVDAVSIDVLQSYHAAGLSLSAKQEPADEISTELEFMHYLLACNKEEEFNSFAQQHAQSWMPDLAHAVEAETDEPLYHHAAHLLAQTLESTAALNLE